MLVKLAISQQLFYMILSNFHILYKSTCSFHWLLNCGWLRPIYNLNSVSNLTVFSARLCMLFISYQMNYIRALSKTTCLTDNFAAAFLYDLSHFCIFYKINCPFHQLFKFSWLRSIYNRNSVSNFTVFCTSVCYLEYYINYARCQKLLVKLTILLDYFKLSCIVQMYFLFPLVDKM